MHFLLVTLICFNDCHTLARLYDGFYFTDEESIYSQFSARKITPFMQVAFVKQNVTIRCSSYGNVTFLKENVGEMPTSQIAYNALYLTNVQLEDAGTYYCQGWTDEYSDAMFIVSSRLFVGG